MGSDWKKQQGLGHTLQTERDGNPGRSGAAWGGRRRPCRPPAVCPAHSHALLSLLPRSHPTELQRFHQALLGRRQSQLHVPSVRLSLRAGSSLQRLPSHCRLGTC